MALFAGVFGRTERGRRAIDEGFEILRATLSRRPGASPVELRGPTYRVACIAGAEEGGGFESGAEGVLTLIGGEPILARGDAGHDPAHDRRLLHDALCRGDYNVVAKARGSFCAVHIDPARCRVEFVADKLALRPVFFSVRKDLVMFSSALRVLEAHPLVARHGALQSSVELAALGFTLGTRTALREVETLAPAQTVRVTRDGVCVSEYWRWDEIEARTAPPEAVCEALREEFERAVRLRLGTTTRATALLSGGLDSRVVVSTLRASGTRVDTINFAPAGSADLILGREAARLLGTQHFEAEFGVPEFWPRLAHAFAAWRRARRVPTAETHRLWSGEGGDRVLAPVNLSPSVVAQMRAGETAAAIASYLRDEHVALPRRIFRAAMYPAVRDLHVRGIREEVERFRSADPARRFHLYVLCNESRQNIKAHFEDYDLHGIELVMPFYDSEFVRVALSYPIDEFLQHRLYYRWLEVLPGAPASVPWQAYPSSLPCPLVAPLRLRSQWNGWYTRRELREQQRRRRRLAKEVLRDESFPDWLLSRRTLRAARALLVARFDRFGHLFESAAPFVRNPPPSITVPGR